MNRLFAFVAALTLTALTVTSSCLAHSVDNLRFTLQLPAGADNTFQGLSNTVTFTFDATQRAANTAL